MHAGNAGRAEREPEQPLRLGHLEALDQEDIHAQFLGQRRPGRTAQRDQPVAVVDVAHDAVALAICPVHIEVAHRADGDALLAVDAAHRVQHCPHAGVLRCVGSRDAGHANEIDVHVDLAPLGALLEHVVTGRIVGRGDLERVAAAPLLNDGLELRCGRKDDRRDRLQEPRIDRHEGMVGGEIRAHLTVRQQES